MGLGSNVSRGCNLMVLGVSRICDWALLNEQDFVFCARFHKRDLVKHFFKTILVMFQRLLSVMEKAIMWSWDFC